MTEDKDHVDDRRQELFEQYIFSLMDKGELNFPKAGIYPEKGIIETLPLESLSGRLTTFFNNIGRLFLKPAVAYLLVLCLIYPAYRGMFQKPEVVKQIVKEKEVVEVPKPIGGIGTARDFSLGAVGGTRSRDEEKKIELPRTDDFFTLSFFIPINRIAPRGRPETKPNLRYDLEIKDENGNLVDKRKEISSRDALGNFSLVCTKELFKDGRYVLKVFKVNTATSTIEEEYNFKFKIVRSIS